MKWVCAIGGHRAAGAAVYNSGFYFSGCGRCGRHLIRTARSDWDRVPAGHQVVWKGGRHSHSLEADFSGVLPVAAEATPSLPATCSPFHSWSRAMVRFGRAEAAAPARVADEELGDDYRYPRLLLAAVIVGAGLKMLLSLATGR